MLKISELLNLFKNESCKNKVDYELIKTDTPFFCAVFTISLTSCVL